MKSLIQSERLLYRFTPCLQAMKNGEWGMGIREWGIGSREWGEIHNQSQNLMSNATTNSQEERPEAAKSRRPGSSPTPHSTLPIPYSHTEQSGNNFQQDRARIFGGVRLTFLLYQMGLIGPIG